MGVRLRRAIGWAGSPGNLRYVVAGLAALALFGYVVDLASHGDLLGQVGRVLVKFGWLALVIAIPFFALRALTWHLLLDQVGVRAPLRETVAAFCAGELTKSLPGGVYLETYVLARIERLNERAIVGAAVATTGMDVMIGTVAFLTAMLIGLPERGWFRLMLIAVAGAWIVLFGAVVAVVRWWRPHQHGSPPGWLQTVVRIADEAITGARRLVQPKAIRPLSATAAYMTLYAIVLWLVLLALNLSAIGFAAAISVVAITMLANDLLPVPMELGLTEITGVGVLGAYGVEATAAAIVMLCYRVLTTGSSTIVVLSVMAYLRDAFRPSR